MVLVAAHGAAFALIRGQRIRNGRNFLFVAIRIGAIAAEHLIVAAAAAAQWEITIATGAPLLGAIANKTPEKKIGASQPPHKPSNTAELAKQLHIPRIFEAL